MRKCLSCFLAALLLCHIILPQTANAIESKVYADVTSIISDSGENLTYSIAYDSGRTIIECRKTSGMLVERSVLCNGVVTQEIANGIRDGSEYIVAEHITRVKNAPGPNLDADRAVGYSNYWYEPPLMNDAGLSNSPIFSGYKYLGTTSPDSTYGVSVSVHRRLDRQADGEAYRFQVSPGTTVATLVSILIGLSNLPLAIATSLATAFIGAGIDTLAAGTLKYLQFHYTYKYNCNNSSTYSYKCCECKQFWCIYDANGNLKGYEVKNLNADNHVTVSILQKCPMVIQDYLDGRQINASCAKAPY